MLCVMMLPLVVVGCNISSLVSQCVEATTPPPAWIMQPPDWQTPLNGIISPSEREADHYAKQLEGTQKYINEQVDRVAHIDGQLMQLL